MMHASVITRTSDFFDLQNDWNDLIRRSNNATVFDTFGWLYNWWMFIGRKAVTAKLQICLLRNDDGLLVGIFPFYTVVWGLWPLRKLLAIGNGTSDYLDLIAADGCEEAVLDEFMNVLLNHVKWHIASFTQCREDGLLQRLIDQNNLGSFKTLLIPHEKCPYVAIPNDGLESDPWELLLASYSKKMRGNIRYNDRALDRVFKVERKIVSNKEELRQVLTALFQLHQRRWNSRWLPGVFYRRRTRQFHCQVAEDLLSHGWLRMHYLLLDNSIEAVLYCFAINGETSYYQGGFEPTMARFSLGTVLTSLAIKQAAVDRCRKFDFLRGDESYKLRWTKTAAWNKTLLFSRKDFILFSLAASMTRLQHWLERSLKTWMHRQADGRGAAAERGAV